MIDAQRSSVSAPFGRRQGTVLHSRTVGAYRVLTLQDAGPAPAAGQFYMLAAVHCWGGDEQQRPWLARAFSVLRTRPHLEDTLALDFLLESVGPGTARLGELAAGEPVWLAGPLGRGFELPAAGRRALLAGGGVGIAPLAQWQDELAQRGLPALALLGFRDRAHAAGAELLQHPRVASDDGSVGHHGLVTELLAVELEGDAQVTVYACGPPPMLEAVRADCAARGVPAQLALESGMACGFGACFGCVVPRRGGGYLRVCVDGPVVDAAELASALAPAPAELA